MKAKRQGISLMGSKQSFELLFKNRKREISTFKFWLVRVNKKGVFVAGKPKRQNKKTKNTDVIQSPCRQMGMRARVSGRMRHKEEKGRNSIVIGSKNVRSAASNYIDWRRSWRSYFLIFFILLIYFFFFVKQEMSLVNSLKSYWGE